MGGRPGLELFREYLDDPATTAQSFTEDGWFRTGDLARCEGGRYYFAGRRNDVLKVAGENVSLPEVEAVLAEHPSVFEAAVVGRPDPIRDEVPVAYVVTREDVARPDRRRAGAMVRRPAEPAQASSRIHLRRRTPAHVRRQDPEVLAALTLPPAVAVRQLAVALNRPMSSPKTCAVQG